VFSVGCGDSGAVVGTALDWSCHGGHFGTGFVSVALRLRAMRAVEFKVVATDPEELRGWCGWE
jgi:hypothetical protein